MSEQMHGHVTAVATETLGDELAQAAGPGALVLVLLDVADFDEDGGSLRIGGNGGAVYGYQWVDDDPDADTGTLRLSSPLSEAADVGETVEVWDPVARVPVVESIATVVDDTTGDVVEATVDHTLLSLLADTQRGGASESVVCAQDADTGPDGVWYVVQVLGKPAALDGGLVAYNDDGTPRTSIDPEEGTLTATGATITGRLTSDEGLFTSPVQASTAPGNEPALRVGPPSGRHLRLDGDDLYAMDDDDTQGEFFANPGGITRVTDLNVMGRVRSPLLVNNAVVGEESLTFRCIDSAGNTRGEAQFSRGSNYKWKIRNTGQPSAGGVSLVALDTRIGVCRAGMDATDFTENNTQSFVANQITAFNGFFDNSANSGGSDPAYFNSGGRLVRGGGSSRRVKHVDAELDLATARRILALQPVRYRYRTEVDELGDDAVTYPGFVAEDADAAGLDLWVSYDDQGRPARIRYAELTTALVALASDQERRLARLEAAVARLDPDFTTDD